MNADPVCYGPCHYTPDGHPRPFGATRALCDWTYKTPRALTKDPATVTCQRCLCALESVLGKLAGRGQADAVPVPAAGPKVVDRSPVDPGAGGVQSFGLQRRA